MSEILPNGRFSVPEVRDFVPERVKPWLFILFVLIVQFAGAMYPAAASYVVGFRGILAEDVMMAGCAQMAGMAVYFALMFRIKFRFQTCYTLLASVSVMLLGNVLCALTGSVHVLVATAFFVGMARMCATFACNSTIQLWLTPVRDMTMFFPYVMIIVECMMALSGITSVYLSFFATWQYMHWLVAGMLIVLLLMVLVLLRPVKGQNGMPLLGIDWTGAVLWSVFMLCFSFVCVYGDFCDWLASGEIRIAVMIGLACFAVNLWRATFLRHPYISFQAMTEPNLVRAVVIYLVFNTLMASSNILFKGFATTVLGFDMTNSADLNWYSFAGAVCGSVFSYYTFYRSKWRYKSMITVAFALTAAYLAWSYFLLDYNAEKTSLALPLACASAATVILNAVLLTSIVQSGLPFNIFPQAVAVNSFVGTLGNATFAPAIIKEVLQHTMAKNASLIGAPMTDFNPDAAHLPLNGLMGTVQQQAFAVSAKEIFGWLLIVALVCLLLLLASWSPIRPRAIFPSWSRLRYIVKKAVFPFRAASGN